MVLCRRGELLEGRQPDLPTRLQCGPAKRLAVVFVQRFEQSEPAERGARGVDVGDDRRQPVEGVRPPLPTPPESGIVAGVFGLVGGVGVEPVVVDHAVGLPALAGRARVEQRAPSATRMGGESRRTRPRGAPSTVRAPATTRIAAERSASALMGAVVVSPSAAVHTATQRGATPSRSAASKRVPVQVGLVDARRAAGLHLDDHALDGKSVTRPPSNRSNRPDRTSRPSAKGRRAESSGRGHHLGSTGGHDSRTRAARSSEVVAKIGDHVGRRRVEPREACGCSVQL